MTTKLFNKPLDVQQFSIVIPLIQYEVDNIPKIVDISKEVEVHYSEDDQAEQDQEEDHQDSSEEEVELTRKPAATEVEVERFLSEMLPDNLLNKVLF